MELTPQVFNARVMHRRYFPRVNAFTYSVYYIALPLSSLSSLSGSWLFACNRAALFSFHAKDHGARDGSDLAAWAESIFRRNGMDVPGGEIMLVTMPRVFGFVFNPVSFWLCHDPAGRLRAMIAEVNNTFGETHAYLCIPADGEEITPRTMMRAQKLFHVSPFLERKGDYDFRINSSGASLGLWIDYYNENGEKQLATALTGRLQPFSAAALLHAFAMVPFVTLKTVLLIHWQAIMLALKKIAYIDKPPQKRIRTSKTGVNLTDL